MSEHSVTDVTRRPLVAALDAAIAAQQDVIKQLVRARAEVLRLVDGAIDDYEAERDPTPCADYLPEPEPNSMLDDPILFPDQRFAQSVKRQTGGA